MVAEMGDPHKPGYMSVTIKSDGKDGTWMVFHGTVAEIRRQIVEVFDLTQEGDEQAPLYDLVNEATRLYKASGNLNSALGGRVIGSGSSAKTSSGGGGSAWEKAANTPQEDAVDINVVRLTKAIEAATDVASLKEIFARDKAHFDANPDLLAEWKAKGKALSSS